MLATLFHLPKWLLAIVAMCVLAGYGEQVKCKIGGCKSAVAAAHSDSTKEGGKTTPAQDEHNCQCQCHFTTLALGETPASPVSFIGVVAVEPPVWIDGAPEAPCADIEHPPQLA